VLPEDLIEFKLRDPDLNAAVQVTNLGYIRKGDVEDLKKWLAYQVYLEKPPLRGAEVNPSQSVHRAYDSAFQGWFRGCLELVTQPCHIIDRVLGASWF
jgi:hypothetical protein